MIDSGRTIAGVARELGINEALLGRCVARCGETTDSRVGNMNSCAHLRVVT